MKELMDAWINERVKGWMNEGVNGCMDEWKGGWMKGSQMDSVMASSLGPNASIHKILKSDE